MSLSSVPDSSYVSLMCPCQVSLTQATSALCVPDPFGDHVAKGGRKRNTASRALVIEPSKKMWRSRECHLLEYLFCLGTNILFRLSKKAFMCPGQAWVTRAYDLPARLDEARRKAGTPLVSRTQERICVLVPCLKNPGKDLCPGTLSQEPRKGSVSWYLVSGTQERICVLVPCLKNPGKDLCPGTLSQEPRKGSVSWYLVSRTQGSVSWYSIQPGICAVPCPAQCLIKLYQTQWGICALPCAVFDHTVSSTVQDM